MERFTLKVQREVIASIIQNLVMSRSEVIEVFGRQQKQDKRRRPDSPVVKINRSSWQVQILDITTWCSVHIDVDADAVRDPNIDSRSDGEM